MTAAGFKYTGDRDTARCEHCDLEAFNWTADMNPFTIHSEESPHCSYVRSMKPSRFFDAFESSSSSSSSIVRTASILDEKENPPKRQKIDLISRLNNLFEPESLQQCRRQTFSQWSHSGDLSSERMVQAGFFSCNTDDRSICLYCDLACEQWTPNVDNPIEVHKALSPTCVYVNEKLKLAKPPPIINGGTSSMTAAASIPIHAPANRNPLAFSRLARPVAKKLSDSAVHRHASAAPTYPVDNSLSIDELIQTNTMSTESQFDVNQFCCKDLLDHWDPDFNSYTELNCWLSHWANSKQLYGDILYHQIQQANRAHQLSAYMRRLDKMASPHVVANTNPTQNNRQSLMSNRSVLSVIIRCWQSSLERKHRCSDCYRDLFILRFIHQKQIELGENIIVPCIKLKQISDEATKRHQEKHGPEKISVESCVVCLAEKSQVAFVPCGHLKTCVPCAHSLKLCPLCRQEIKGYVEIHV